MWVAPRATIRSLTQEGISYGLWFIASIFALENYFFMVNSWSLGLRISFVYLILIGVLISPFIGKAWVEVLGRIFYYTGHWLKGSAPLIHLQIAITWSKIPSLGILCCWITILFMSPEGVFIQAGSGNPYILIFHFLNIVFALWSTVLLIQSIREVENFSLIRSIVNILLAWSILTIPIWAITFLLFYIARF